MALFDTSIAPRPSMLARLARLFDTPFDQRSRDIRARAAALRSLSDKELETRGMTRDTILLHVLGAHPQSAR
ncbi:hypothetical protein ACN2XU_07785 [Primorskyibacter sp. 2E107]|uniref:hypothetical protein n=1 Tax=Primorskyibacter sp. 2E107 TaxID=3403458 RepID=UPI003AF770DB